MNIYSDTVTFTDRSVEAYYVVYGKVISPPESKITYYDPSEKIKYS